MIIIINAQKENLQEMVQKYQQGDATAAEQLRQQFAPLIYKLSHRQSMYSIFGEDAEDMAWLLFYEFIFNYKGCDFVRLPGLVRRFLIFRLLRAMQQQGVRWDTECYLEGEDFTEEAVECKPLERICNNLALEHAFKSLSDKELRVIEELFYNDNDQIVTGKILGCTSRSVRTYKNKALKRLKRYFKI